MAPSTVKRKSKNTLLCFDYSYDIDVELRSIIGNALGAPVKSSGGCLAIGEISETYSSEKGSIDLFFDEGFGYQIASETIDLMDVVANLIDESNLLTLDKTPNHEMKTDEI